MFKLHNFEREITEYANKSKASLKDALDSFIYNLAVMKPHFEGFGDTVDFRSLGQQWNKLSSDERVKQKKEMLSLLTEKPISSKRIK